MLYIQEQSLKLAGTTIPGQVKDVSVTETGKIEDKKNKKGKVTKANQPAGFEAAKVDFTITFEESNAYTAMNQIQFIQRLFKKTSKQKKQIKYRIYEEMTNARGITEVYFNEFTTKHNVYESFYTGTLSFVAPKIAAVSVVKTKAENAAAKAAAAKAAAKKTAKNSKKKTKKKKKKSPAKDTTNKNKAKKKAKNLIK